MKVTIHKQLHQDRAVYCTYTIAGRKDPIVEVYITDKGALVLGATTTGGYMRRHYKSLSAARRQAESYAKTFCRFYWDECEIV